VEVTGSNPVAPTNLFLWFTGIAPDFSSPQANPRLEDWFIQTALDP